MKSSSCQLTTCSVKRYMLWGIIGVEVILMMFILYKLYRTHHNQPTQNK